MRCANDERNVPDCKNSQYVFCNQEDPAEEELQSALTFKVAHCAAERIGEGDRARQQLQRRGKVVGGVSRQWCGIKRVVDDGYAQGCHVHP